jgi:hypothetical protein
MGAPPPQDMGKSLMSDLRSAISQAKSGQPAPEAKPQAAPAKQEAAAKPALEQPGDRTEAKIEAPAKDAKPKKAAAPKNPWEASVVDPDASSESGEGDAPSSEGDTPEPEFKSESQKLKWGELKKKATEFDALQKKYAEMEQMMLDFEKKPKLPSEVEQELNELRQFRAGYDIQNTPEYAEAVAKPYQAQVSRIQEVADYAGVDINKLMDAANEPNTLRRAKAIRDVLASSEAEMGEQEISIAVRAADTLHSEVYPKDLELRSKATEIQQGLKGRSEIESAKQREAREQSFKQASTEMFDTLKAKLGPLKIFDDADVAKNVQGAALADPLENPMMAAYQAQAAAVTPILVQQINDLRTQLAAAQKVLKARGAAEATTGDTSRQSLDTPRKGPDNGRSLADSLKSLGVR